MYKPGKKAMAVGLLTGLAIGTAVTAINKRKDFEIDKKMAAYKGMKKAKELDEYSKNLRRNGDNNGL